MLMGLRRSLAVLMGVLALCGHALAADIAIGTKYSPPAPGASNLPAVSGPNAKFDFRGGLVNGALAGYGVGSLSLPVGQKLGLQVDGLIGTNGGFFTAAVGGHAFWRDPSVGLFGAYGDVGYDARLSGLRVAHSAAEVELYLGRLTGRGLFGYQFGNVATGFLAKAELAVYLTDNLSVYGGYIHQPGVADRGIVGAEALVSQKGVSLFGEGRIGSGQWSALAGVRLYNGKSKTLIDRHRKDDPIDHFGLVTDAFTSYKPPSSGGSSEGSTPSYLVTVSITPGSGSGIVTSPAGITCGTTCSVSVPSGTSITLTATPAINSEHTWGGLCSAAPTNTCTFTVTAPMSVSVEFDAFLVFEPA